MPKLIPLKAVNKYFAFGNNTVSSRWAGALAVVSLWLPQMFKKEYFNRTENVRLVVAAGLFQRVQKAGGSLIKVRIWSCAEYSEWNHESLWYFEVYWMSLFFYFVAIQLGFLSRCSRLLFVLSRALLYR
jgi:hypothetical protein